MNGRPPSAAWRHHERLARIAPLPFVAVSAILVTLILFTPVLLSSGSSLYLAQGELIVYRVGSANWTKLAVEPRDQLQVNYSSVELDLGSGFVWNGTCPTGGLSWTNTSDHQAFALLASTTENPVVVNSSATYQGPDGPVIFAGAFALDVSNATGTPELSIAPCPAATPGITAPVPSVAVGDLPIILLLNNYGGSFP